MRRFTAPEVICRVHTRKQGLLSRIAHDLCFEVDALDVQVTTSGGQATLDPMALRLLGAERDGAVDPKILSNMDQGRILENLREDVLDVRKFPEITYRWAPLSQVGMTATLQGQLRLHGVERPMAFQGSVTGDQVVLSARLDQRDFGIVPFRAALGALKVHPELRIELRVALSTLRADA